MRTKSDDNNNNSDAEEDKIGRRTEERINNNGRFRHCSLSLLDSNGNDVGEVQDGFLLQKRSASLPVDDAWKKRRRKTACVDVEEALSSLLWQPYEYREKTWIGEVELAPPTPPGCHTDDLGDRPGNNEPNDKTKTAGNAATDLHLSDDMVNNLSVLEKRSDQSEAPLEPRDLTESATPSAPSVGFVSCPSEATWCHRRDDGVNGVSACDADSGIMRQQVEGPSSVVQVNAASSSTERPQPFQTTIQNLSSANVVGLPNHPRQASVPASLAAVPKGCAHARNSSEPCSFTQQVNQFRNKSEQPSSCYRAVPVNVISSVPTIQCLNSGNNVSNVQIMPLGDPPPVLPPPPSSTQVQVQVTPVQPTPRQQRTFTSTEAQTDDVGNVAARETRRRRRERRPRPLPDILNSHLPPPYSPVQQGPPGGVVGAGVVGAVQGVVPSAILPFPQVVPGQVPLVQGNAPVAVATPGFRFPFPATGMRSRYSEVQPKGCCGLPVWKPGSLRWFIVLIALVGVCCVLVGTALGAMRPAGRDHLTVSLLMIGVGIILVTVSGVAWRLTSHDASTCRSLWGLSGSTESVDVCGTSTGGAVAGVGGGGGGARRFMPRLPPSYGRPHHPYAAMLYPEFQYRPPPPSYQASMQEYRLRLLLLDRSNTPRIEAGTRGAVSPPPTYRSHSGSLLRTSLSHRRDATQSEYSCPPSYRSQTSSTRQPPIATTQPASPVDQPITLSDSNHTDSVVNVVSIFSGSDHRHHHPDDDDDIMLDNLTIESLKLEPDGDLNRLTGSMKGSSCDIEEGNLVTIVQTGDQSPVIVTVSGNAHAHLTEIPPEMEILAHL